MEKLDTEKMNYAELTAHVKNLTGTLQRKRAEAMEDVISRFLTDAEENQLSVSELLAEIHKRFSTKPSKVVKKAAAAGAMAGFEKGVTYFNPKNSKDFWVGGSRGPKPIWLLEQFTEGMGADEIAKKHLDLKQPK